MSPDDLTLRDAPPTSDRTTPHPDDRRTARPRPSRAQRIVGLIFPVLLVLAVAGYFAARRYVRKAMREALPRLDGTIAVAGLVSPVTVARDARGVPYLHARSLDDLVFAQGYVTAQDRLWQMDLLRRHAAGELAAILGSSMVDHDRLQRTLQVRTAAGRAVAVLPADQMHWLEVYARGVNASIDAQRAHLPIEFRALNYQPAPWTPLDSLLVELATFQDLTTGFPEKLGREALAAHLAPDLIADLYPVGSWRDHPPDQPIPDLTAPQPEFEDIPLDKSQIGLRSPAPEPEPRPSVPPAALLALENTLALFHNPCDSCVSGSNGWAIAGSRTASGKPLLANDMHLSLTVPGLWYEADLAADPTATTAAFHVAGVTLPGAPFVRAGHNDHVAWGLTSLGADVQDIYIEHTRNTPTGEEFQSPPEPGSTAGAWRPILYRPEIIHVRGRADITLNVALTRHGDADTPILSSILAGETRTLSLRWVIYDPASVTDPAFAVDSASDWPSMLLAASTWGGPSLNLMYADDRGNIGYHAVGHIPLRGDQPGNQLANPAPLSPVPIDTAAPDAAAHEWASTTRYIPFDQLPQAFDPPDGVLATANARITPDGYAYPITLNWAAPYRTERIYKVLEAGHRLTPADMLALQTDVFSEVDQVIAQRLAYSIDHTAGPLRNSKTLHQAADLLRNWNGNVEATAAAPAIVNAARAVFWPMLLTPKLNPPGNQPPPNPNLWQSYHWGERSSVEEQLFTHTPVRWLPPGYATWKDFLAAAVDRGLREAHAPRDLSAWSQGAAFPVDLEHPIFSRSALLVRLIGIGVPTGTGVQPPSGDSTTVKQVGRAFGPSERFTADFGDLDRTTLNLVLGQSGNLSSPWYMDQFPAWLHGATYPLPYSPSAVHATHTLNLTPQ
jgi:penicillin G amidase